MLDRPLRIYSEDGLTPPDMRIALLAPFYGSVKEDPEDPFSFRFSEYHRDAQQIFELASLGDADLAVLPFDYGHVLNKAIGHRVAADFVERARAEGKTTLVFSWHDSCEPIPLEGVLTIRTAQRRSDMNPRTEVLPTWPEDFVERYCSGKLPLRVKDELPVVGFCGRAHPLDQPLLARTKCWLQGVKKQMLEDARWYPYKQLRSACMRRLQHAEGIECRFIVKNGFWGRDEESSLPVSVQERVKAREVYVQNMLESDYVLCIRGTGNFSNRFYEALCCGRIPLLVDTDAPLPFEEKIRWDNYIVRVHVNDSKRLAGRVREFHRGLSQAEFEARQKSIRAIWLNYCAPLGFYRTVASWLQQHIATDNKDTTTPLLHSHSSSSIERSSHVSFHRPLTGGQGSQSK